VVLCGHSYAATACALSSVSPSSNDPLARDRRQLRDDVMTGFAADQNSAHWAAIADPHLWAPALSLRCVKIGEVGATPFAGMSDPHARGSA
jgi:hypothetical protein